MIQLKIKLLRPEAAPPSKQTEGSAGMDLHACLDKPEVLQPMERLAIPTGIAIELPLGYEAQLRARSGFAINQGIGLVNGIGTIDPDFRGEIKVLVINWGTEPVTITPGMRIAQMVVGKYETVDWQYSEELSQSGRSDGGFGSTGSGGQSVL
jgi:dUTP pyrophosphatase